MRSDAVPTSARTSTRCAVRGEDVLTPYSSTTTESTVGPEPVETLPSVTVTWSSDPRSTCVRTGTPWIDVATDEAPGTCCAMRSEIVRSATAATARSVPIPSTTSSTATIATTIAGRLTRRSR